MRIILAALFVVSIVGCGGPKERAADAPPQPIDAGPPCVGLNCRIVDCAKDGLPPTSLSGTVFAPNGTLALYDVTVYVPNLDPGTFPVGATCDRCDATIPLPGEPIQRAQSDEAGHFSLVNVPAGSDIPLILTIGKWRRKALLPAVIPCQDNPLPAMYTSLPKNRNEGDLPKIAIATGGCDALECLVRKIGVSDGEFSPEGGTGAVHLYAGDGGSTKMQNNGTLLTAATTLWGDLEKLKNYDIMLASCECSQDAAAKTQAMMDNVKAYADFGGRIFLSHYHNVWIGGERNVPTHAPAVWPTIATCNIDTTVSGDDIIDQVDNPRGESFATWMLNVQGSTTLGSIPITEGKSTCASIDSAKADRWVYHPSSNSPQNFQFTTPNEIEPEMRCGKVAFSDMHVASGSSSSSSGFPAGCAGTAMTPQEKALAFMFFDIASCVGVIF